MLSLILYGRNDSYGYNLHKRAAISLNCMAEMLTSPDDEIIFVDYNTPDDFPTFPEAIQDTLTERAKRLLRILRVRPSQHEPFRHLTRLVALEPIARNVAVRRSNPENRWILSTNTDMVFVPQRGASLSEVAAGLPDGYYHLPRFELPETLWESLDRLNPSQTIASIGEWGRTFHLNEIVFASDPMVRYDAPGDFQLILRTDLWCAHGFNESMLLGWHVDSNMAKRLALLPRRIGDVVDDVFGYHCDHTRQVTPMHRTGATENDLQTFFEDVTIPQLPAQAETWGLAGEHVEELKIDTTSRVYLAALHSSISAPLSTPTHLHYDGKSFNHTDYLVDHIVPFLADIFASYPRTTILGWFGSKRSLLERFSQTWTAMGFSEPIMVYDKAYWLGADLPAGCVWSTDTAVAERCDVFVFDWGRVDDIAAGEDWEFATDRVVRSVMLAFRNMVQVERQRLKDGSGALRRFIGVNAINNDVERLFNERIGAARTPIATRIRQGYIQGESGDDAGGRPIALDLVPVLHAGSAGQKLSTGIVSLPGVAGFIFFGPYLDLEREAYRLTLGFERPETPRSANGETGLVLAILSGGYLLGFSPIGFEQLAQGSFQIEFQNSKVVSEAQSFPRVEFRLLTTGQTELTISTAVLEEIDASGVATDVSSDFDCFPLLNVGDAGSPARAQGGPAIQARPDEIGYLAFGPYIWLLPGHYEATFSFDAERTEIEAFFKAEVVTRLGDEVLAERAIQTNWKERWFERIGGPHRRRLTCVLEFDIATEALPQYRGLLEFRVWSPGTINFSFVGLKVRNVGPAREPVPEAIAVFPVTDYLPQVIVAGAGLPALRRGGLAVMARRGVVDYIVCGPYGWLPHGHYEATFAFDAVRADRRSVFKVEVVTHFGRQILAERLIQTHWRGRRFERIFGRRNGRLTCVLEFDITTDAPPADEGLLEFRVWSPGTIDFSLIGLSVRGLSADQEAAVEAVAVSP